MVSQQYLTKLQDLLLEKITVYTLLLLLVLIIWFIVFKIKRRSHKCILIIAGVVFGYCLIRWVIPVSLDIHNKTVYTASTVGYRHVYDSGGGYKSGYFSAAGGDTITVYFPDGNSEYLTIAYKEDIANEHKFPYGDYTGKIVYTKYSDLVFSFTVEEEGLPQAVLDKNPNLGEQPDTSIPGIFKHPVLWCCIAVFIVGCLFWKYLEKQEEKIYKK